MKRDLYIDWVKGIATLSIIFIHTTFWSGQLYVPREVRSISLFLDVPVFFLLSGFTSSSNLSKTWYRLLRMQFTYMVFMGSVFVLVSIINPAEFRISTLGNWWLHSYTPSKTFPVLISGLWYLKVYFIVTFFAILILNYFEKYINWAIALCVTFILIFNYGLDSYPKGQVGYTVFYLAIFLSAHQLKGKKISTRLIPILYIGFLVLVAWCLYYYGLNIFNWINKQKFPPKLPYITASLLSLISISCFYNRTKIAKENWLTFVGKNAIFFYFAQGISSTIIYFLVEPSKDFFSWPILLVISYGANVILSFGIAYIIKIIDQFFWKKLGDKILINKS